MTRNYWKFASLVLLALLCASWFRAGRAKAQTQTGLSVHLTLLTDNPSKPNSALYKVLGTAFRVFLR